MKYIRRVVNTVNMGYGQQCGNYLYVLRGREHDRRSGEGIGEC